MRPAASSYRLIFSRLILAAGLATFAVMIWKFDSAAAWSHVSKGGAWLLLLLPIHIVDYVLGALGWRMTFNPKDARALPFWDLVRIRIAGDGVNYLTPSGTIAGELIRPEMLGKRLPDGVKNASVVLSKLTESLAQALFIFLGLLFVLWENPELLRGRQLRAGMGVAAAILCVLAAAVFLLTRRHGGLSRLLPHGVFGTMREDVRSYLRRHPGRLAVSTLCFMLGYLWGAVEAFLICRLIGHPVALGTALSIEILSNLFDMATFMVPARVGVQEASKIAIFRGLGYPASHGLAFGLIRHVRELIWASAGFILYGLSRRAVPVVRRVKALA